MASRLARTFVLAVLVALMVGVPPASAQPPGLPGCRRRSR